MGVSSLNHATRTQASPLLRPYRDLLSRYLKPQQKWVILMSALLLAGIVIQLVNPQVLRYFLDTAQAGGQRAGAPGEGTRSLYLAAVLFLAFAILQQAMLLATRYTAARVGWASTNQLRSDLVLHVLRLDMSFHKTRTPGELIDRVDGDVTLLSNFLSRFIIDVIGNGLLVLGILALLFRENAWLGLGMMAYTLLTLLVLRSIQGLAAPRWAAERQASALLYGFIEERISGAEEIRAAGAVSYVMRQLYAWMRDFTRKARAATVFTRLTFDLTNLVYVIGYAAGLATGVILFMRGDASLGTAYLITYYVGMLYEPLQAIRRQAEDLQQASANIQRVTELFSQRPLLNLGIAAQKRLPHGALAVCLQDVSFHYDDRLNGGHTQVNEMAPGRAGEPGQPESASGPGNANTPNDASVLKNIGFVIQPGRVLGILGRTGSGKSTLTRLLFRLYDPNQGVVHLGGVDLREVSLEDLRRRVAMVTQDVQLFQASVRDNLTFFNRAIPDEQIEHALRELRLWEWVQSLPNGLDTRLTGGQSLSAGEAQLLAFARVFLKNPGLVILDEASSRLDPATEMLMERAVEQLFTGRTGVLVAHRLKTVQRADDILILENGRVVEYGPRVSLAADPSARFYRLLQTGLEEALA